MKHSFAIPSLISFNIVFLEATTTVAVATRRGLGVSVAVATVMDLVTKGSVKRLGIVGK